MDGDFITRSTGEGSSRRSFAVYVPRCYGGRPVPAILFLHGRGECGADGFSQLGVGLGPAIIAEPDRWPF
ncbi:MAG: phospholipase, partial [Deltaproteobacteria bacterium]